MPVSRASLSPLSAEFPSAAGFPELKRVNDRFVLAFDAAADETARWTFLAPQGMVLPLTLLAHGIMASATTGAVVLQAAVECITPGDALDLDSATSFDTPNTSSATTVPATAGQLFTISITLTNNDSIATGDLVRLSLNRDADNAGDTAAGDYDFLQAEIRDFA
jgi:hypothetical protein